MTEKRFTETVSTGDVHDTLTGKSYRCEYRIDDEFLELVNNIAEENEQLNQHIDEVEKDNERLEKITSQFEVGDIVNLKFANEVVDEQRKTIRELKKENEQLKCGNKNLKAVLNDFINILNRLQCNPNNEQTLNVARDMLQNMGKELEE